MSQLNKASCGLIFLMSIHRRIGGLYSVGSIEACLFQLLFKILIRFSIPVGPSGKSFVLGLRLVNFFHLWLKSNVIGSLIEYSLG